MRVLVTGTEGYLGHVLAPTLAADGHEVIGVDTGFYREAQLYRGVPMQSLTLFKDIRALTRDDLEGVDAVVHMAELSNDPLGQLAPTITYEINHVGSVQLAELAKSAGVQRFVYMSSCSVYGVAGGSDMTEESDVNPQTAYAECKVMVERDVKPLADDGFSPTFMRNATAFGASPRMRFDIVVNNLSGLAWTTKRIAMNSDGTPWRPLVHALDIARSIRCVLAADRQIVHNQTFNVGDTKQNYQVKEIAEIVADVFPGCALSFGSQDSDNRSYKVNFDKINSLLPGFACEWDVRRGAEQLRAVFEQIEMPPETFGHRAFTRLESLKHLIATHQIDDRFFWTY
jgi:nucleoside-diphosphate-sugar epimerase